MSGARGGPAAFASAIARRYRGGRVRQAPIARVLRRAPRPTLRTSPPAGVTFAPVLRFTLAIGAGASTARTRADRARDAMDARAAPVARTLARPVETERAPLAISAPLVVATARRVGAHGVRVDGATRAPSGATLAIAPPARPTDVARPVPRVLGKRSVVLDGEATTETRSVPRATLRSANAPPPPVTLSTTEVDRLTAHVLQTMDRRIAAFRERQGRV